MYKHMSMQMQNRGKQPANVATQRRGNERARLIDNRNPPAYLNGIQPLQKADNALMERADNMIAKLNDDPVNVDVGHLKSTIEELQEKYSDEFDDQYLQKWTAVNDAFLNNFLPIMTKNIRPLLDHIKDKISGRLKGGTPEWVNNLPNIQIAAGEGIAGGLAVGQDAIFVTPATGVELLKEGTAEFAIAHEVAHLISNSIGIAESRGLLRSNSALENSGIEIESTGKNRAAKLEEVRADIFGVDMISSYLDTDPSALDSDRIQGAISAPSDNEHPSSAERKKMLNFFRGIEFD